MDANAIKYQVPAGVAMCIIAMACIQFGAALSAPSIIAYGAAGTTWLRLIVAGTVLMLVVRPPVLRFSRLQWRTALLLGLTTALMTLCFFEAVRRIPLGLLVAVDFLGPLLVATFAYGLSWRILFPVIAGLGVLCLAYDGTQWVGNTEGLLFAAASACGWAAYILLTKKIGSVFEGMQGLAMSLAVAGLVSTPFGLADGASAVNLKGMLPIVGLAFLVPLLPYALEMSALRRLKTATFGILMSLEPGLGALAGYLVLGQAMTVMQMGGVLLVVLASVGATLS